MARASWEWVARSVRPSQTHALSSVNRAWASASRSPEARASAIAFSHQMTASRLCPWAWRTAAYQVISWARSRPALSPAASSSMRSPRRIHLTASE